jgi:hypothetical protein
VEVEEDSSADNMAAMTSGGSVRGGATLATYVPAPALAALSSDERKRQEAIFELIATESVYVRKLRITLSVRTLRHTHTFMHPPTHTCTHTRKHIQEHTR